MTAKILSFDIEASNLNASFGVTLAFGYQWYGESEAKVLSISDYKLYKKDRIDDSALLADVAKILNEADMWVTWYGSRYDVPFLQTRMLYHRMPVLPNMPHVDLCFQSRGKLKMHSNRLAAMSDFFGLTSKTPVVGDHWLRAMAGYKESLDYIVDHCKADVECLTEAYELMRPLIRTHPRVNGFGPCRVCGEKKVQRRGYRMSTTQGRHIRVQCTSCGAWDSYSEAAAYKAGIEKATA